jgi:hypothetical protein
MGNTKAQTSFLLINPLIQMRDGQSSAHPNYLLTLSRSRSSYLRNSDPSEICDRATICASSKPELTIAMLERAEELWTDKGEIPHPTLYYNLGIAHSLLGHVKQAIQAFALSDYSRKRKGLLFDYRIPLACFDLILEHQSAEFFSGYHPLPVLLGGCIQDAENRIPKHNSRGMGDVLWRRSILANLLADTKESKVLALQSAVEFEKEGLEIPSSLRATISSTIATVKKGDYSLTSKQNEYDYAIFYTYHDGKYAAKAVFSMLEGLGFNVFLDSEHKGRRTTDASLDIIPYTQNVILICSPGICKLSNDRGVFFKEVESCVRLKRNIIPITTDNFDWDKVNLPASIASIKRILGLEFISVSMQDLGQQIVSRSDQRMRYEVVAV